MGDAALNAPVPSGGEAETGKTEGAAAPTDTPEKSRKRKKSAAKKVPSVDGAAVSWRGRRRRRAQKGRKHVEAARYEEARRDGVLLCVDDVSVSFDGFKALDRLSLRLAEGELRCLIGPNGAGKTTLQDVITGKTRPDSGSVFLVGDTRELTSMSEHEIAELGIGRKFQKPTVFAGHSVFENLELALSCRRGVFRSLFHRLSGVERTRIDEVLELIGLKEQVKQEAGLLSHGQKQWLEIGMLLAQNPRVLLVDEPVAGMTEQEMDRTAELLNGLAGKHTVIVVEHDMDFVRKIARQVTVLHEGRVLAEGRMDEVQNDQRVIEVYLGKSDAHG